MKGYKHLTQEQIDLIYSTHSKMRNAKETAKRLGLTYQSVRKWLNRAGIPLTNWRENACTRNADLILSLVEQHCSLAEIGRQIGTNPRHVKAYLEQNQIPYTPYGCSGSHNSNWRGGRRVDKDGYILIHFPDHPFCNRHGYVREHRLVMEQMLGRYLTRDEVVHHRDDNHQNNTPENLKLYGSNGEHLAETLEGQIPSWTEDGKRRILESVRRPRGRQQKPSQS